MKTVQFVALVAAVLASMTSGVSAQSEPPHTYDPLPPVYVDPIGKSKPDNKASRRTDVPTNQAQKGKEIARVYRISRDEPELSLRP
jgi:hypothetical protein